MKQTKRFKHLSLGAALLTFLAVVLGACGDNTATPAPATTAAGAATTAAAGAATTAAAGATTAAGGTNSGFTVPNTPITLSIWADAPELEAFYKKVSADYQKIHPNVKFDILALQARDLEAKVAAAVPSDTAADILQGTTSPMQRYVENGLIPKVPPQIVQLITNTTAYPKELTDQLLYKGDYYGMPFYQGRHAIYYNTDYYKAAGVTNPPQTMDDLTTLAQKLVKVENGEMKYSGLSLRLTGAGSGIAEKFLIWLYPNGGDIIVKTPEGKYHSNYNNDAGKKTLKMYIDMLYKYKTDDPKIKHDTEAFELGATAMYLRESNVVGDIAKKAPNLNYDTVPVPKGVRWGDLSSPDDLYVTKSSKNPDVAWDFVLFSQKEEYLNYLLSEIGWIPQRQDYTYAEALKAHPQFKGFTFKDPNYKLYLTPNIGQFDEIETKLAERLSKAFLDPSLLDNDAGIAKVLADAAKETDDILKKANLYG